MLHQCNNLQTYKNEQKFNIKLTFKNEPSFKIVLI